MSLTSTATVAELIEFLSALPADAVVEHLDEVAITMPVPLTQADAATDEEAKPRRPRRARRANGPRRRRRAHASEEHRPPKEGSARHFISEFLQSNKKFTRAEVMAAAESKKIPGHRIDTSLYNMRKIGELNLADGVYSR